MLNRVFKISNKIIFTLLLILYFQNYSVESAEELKLYLNQPKSISVNNPTRIVIANPEVVDVANVSRSEITLTPKKPGKTTLIFWDNFGEQAIKIRVLSENLEEIKEYVDKILTTLDLQDISTQISEEEEKIILWGEISSEDEKNKLFALLGSKKDKLIDFLRLKEEVVEIDVQVIELSQDATKTLGFNWPGYISLTEKSGPLTVPTTGLKNIFHVSDFTRNAFNVTLEALVQEGKARILSRPRLSCLSGKEAELLVGGEKPIMTTESVSGGGSSTNVEYKEYGIKLKIRPFVEKEKIRLSLNVEVSETGAAEILGSSGSPTARAYPLNKRSASTELLLNDGQTMAIGGLVKQKREEDIRKIPFLSGIPVIGALFRKKETRIGGGWGEKADTELFISLTPRIVPSHKEKKKISLKDEKPDSSTEIKTLRKLDPQTQYAQLVQMRIERELVYPHLAKEAGWQGRVKLKLHLSYQGKLLEVEIKESSGYQILDEAAVETVKRIKNFPPFPPALKEDNIWLEIPINYKLD